MSRPHAEWVQDLYRFILASGKAGKRTGEVLTFIGDKASPAAVERSLRRMRLFGYLQVEGGNLRSGSWVIGPRTPHFASEPCEAVEPSGAARLRQLGLVPTPVVNSVFALARNVGPRDLSEMAEASSQPMPLDAIAPAWLERQA